MPIRAVEERRFERERLIAVARDWAAKLAARLGGVRSVVVAGSVARGDFNLWSDLDVLVIADELPPRLHDRLAALMADSPPGMQVFGYTPAELDDERRRRNALVVDASEHGVVVHGEPLAAIGRDGEGRQG